MKRYRYRIFRTDNSIVTMILNEPATSEQLQEWVGGRIGVVSLPGAHGVTLANENGEALGLKTNPYFSWLLGNVVRSLDAGGVS